MSERSVTHATKLGELYDLLGVVYDGAYGASCTEWTDTLRAVIYGGDELAPRPSPFLMPNESLTQRQVKSIVRVFLATVISEWKQSS